MSYKKRVLLVSCGGLGRGGVQAVMMGIVRSLSNQFHFDILLFTSAVRYYDEEFTGYGGRIFRIPHKETGNSLMIRLDPYIRDYRMYKRTCELLSKEPSYDIIHCNKEFESAPILKAAYELKIPVRICHSHIVHPQVNILRQLLELKRAKQIEKYATKLIGCSQKANDTIYGQLKSEVVPNFYREDIFNSNKIKISNYISNRFLTIVQVGAFSRNKNQLFSLAIATELKAMDIKFKLKLIGFDLESAYRKIVDEKIKEDSLENEVSILPGNCDIPLELGDADCCIMPSYSEGFGISLIEAQSMGLHCFVSDSVPGEVDCGGVEFHSLTNGSKYWANAIVEWLQRYTGKEKYDTSNYKTSTIMNRFREIYNGQ